MISIKPKTQKVFINTFKTTFIFIFLCATALAQQNTGTINGTVTTSDDHVGESVTISISELKKTTITDSNGNFTFNKVPTGTYQLQISMMGHQSSTKQAIVTTNEVTTVNFQLESSLKELNEVVVVSAAKKFAEKKSEYVARLPISNLENPQVYTVVPKELFQEQIAVDFRSTLNSAPGLSNVVQSVGSGGVGLSLRMRGFSGASAAGSIRNGMNTNWVTMSDPVNLESIEVIKGPSGTLFGSALTTYGGLINRVTKKPFETAKGEVSYTTGSWALSRTAIDYNTPINEEKTMLFRINAALDNQKTGQDYGKSKTFIIAPSFTLKANDKLTFDFDLEVYNGSRNSISIGMGSGTPTAKSFNDYNFDFKKSYATDELQSEAKNTNAYARATYLISDKWVSQTNFSNSFTDNKANYLFLLINTAANSNTTLQRRLYNINSTFKTSQLQQNFIGNLKTGSIKHRLLVGLDYTYISTNDNRWLINNYDVAAGNPALTINGNAAFINLEKYKSLIAAMPSPTVINNRDFRTTSAYVSNVVNFTDKFIAMASVRFDHYENKIANYNQNTVSPKMGLIYQVVKDKVSVFGNYMNGYTNVAPGATAENPQTEFKPEQANQLEGGVKVELLGGKLNGTLSYYDIEVKNKLRTDPNNSLFSVQDATQRSKGFEADLIANPFRGFHIILGYGYNESEYTKANPVIEGKRPYSTPANVANLWLSYKILDGKVKGLGFGFGGNIQSDSYLNDANTFTVNGYTVMDATVFYEKPKFRLGVKLNNIANKEYWSADYWANMMPTRQLVANLTFKF
ncbi:TonB-dependent receptor [Flavobacterium chungangense]|uniref:TonB-dependent siderophore receptor n=1 Tax=Flavobacterium chungangense TaxID=554283 RepID=A0A6V6YW10_9FLAO|nr:TonB-dependent receptor [Flavobacterium chungangense]CAD0003681.1 TonB-dependent siderophore receptor [Flavobacterium chungangense]